MTETDTTSTTAATESATNDGRVSTALYWAALGGLALLAMISALQFYLSGSRAIRIWVTPEYEPLFQAAFNLVILLVSGIGISLLVRRLAE